MMWNTLFVMVMIFVGAMAHAKTTTTMSSERGFFSSAAGAGDAQQRVLNSTGTYALMTGSMVGGSVDFHLFGDAEGELRLTADMSMSSLKGKELATDSMTQTSTMFGLKSFFSSSFYVAAAYGTNAQTITSSNNESKFTNSVIAAGIGYELPLGETLFISANLWYQNNPIRAEGAVHNSFSEGFRAYVNLIWSPPITIISSTTVSSR